MWLLHRNSNQSKIQRNVSSCIFALVSLIRSRTLVYVFAIVALGTFLIVSGSKIPDFSVMLRLVISVYLVALATYLYNDLTDYKVDKINNRKIVYDQKRSQYYTTLYSTIVFFIISITLAFSINLATGLGSIAFSGLAIAYSHPRTHLKDRFVLKTIVTAAGGCIASIMGSFAAESFSYLAMVSSLIVFLFWFTLGPLGDIGDIRGDREGGRRTIPIVIGVQKTFLMMISVVVSIALMILLTHYFLDMHIIGVTLGIIICAFVAFQIKNLSKQYENKIKIKQTRTSLRYCVFGIQITLLISSILNNLA